MRGQMQPTGTAPGLVRDRAAELLPLQAAFSRKHLAELFDLSFDTIRRATESGALPAKRVGRSVRVTRDAAITWFGSQPDY